MAEYPSTAPLTDFEFLPPAEDSAPEALEERLQQAELFMRLPGLVNYGQPLDDIFAALSRYIVANTSAIAAAVTLVRLADVTTIAQGSCNLPEGYVEGMHAARRDTVHGGRLRESARWNQTWILRNAREYMLSLPEYEPLYPQIAAAAFETVVGTPFPSRPETVGFVYLYYAPGVPVDSSAVAFSRALAAYARPLIDNALLFQESERRTTELEALRRADEALHQSLRLDDVIEAMLDLAESLLAADSSLLATFKPDGHLGVTASRGLSERVLEAVNATYHHFDHAYFERLGKPIPIVVVEDIGREGVVDSRLKQRAAVGSTAEIPVVVGGEAWGIFSIGWRKQRKFSPAERAMFEAFGSRASLAIQNALLFEEAERRTNELDALRRADQALHQSLELTDVIGAMVELARELLGGDSSVVATFTPEGVLAVVDSRGLDQRLLGLINQGYRRFDREHFRKLKRPIQAALVEDVKASRFIDAPLREQTVGSLAEIPVMAGDDVWGIFTIGWRRPRTFSDADRTMLSAFGSRASLAIQNALLFQESQRRGNELEALHRADEALHQSLLLDDVQEAMADLAIELLGASSSLVVTWDDHDRLEVRASRGVYDEALEQINRRYQQFTRDFFASRPGPRRASLIEDVSSHPDLNNFEIQLRNPGSLAEIPVYVAGELWGFFSIGWRERRAFSDSDRRLFDTFASRVSLAIQNAQLYERAQLSASMEERQRIARDLHDSVSQALYGIGLGAKTLRRRIGDDAPASVSDPVDYIVNLAEGGLAETRALIFELMPDSLRTDGLVTALQRQAAATQARHNVQVAAMLCDEPDLPLRTKEALYRIAQESLNNMAKHAHATTASVTLAPREAGYLLVIEDNGRGFDTGQDFPGHLGLRSMQERAAKAGCTYELTSVPGQGTKITVTVD